MSERRFRPPLWAWLGLLPALALLCSLGTWQLSRGQAKQALQGRMDAAATQAPQPLSPGLAPREDGALQVSAQGTYLADRQLLLDNQSHAEQPGAHAWTPLRLDDGSLVMVDRGWLPRAPTPQIDVSAQPREVTGLWRPLPRPALRLAADNCRDAAWPRVVQYPTADDLRCLYGETVADGLLLLSPQAEAGYVRDWRIGGSIPPSRHYGYAAQWYAFAATLLFLFVRLNLKRSKDPAGR